MVEIIYCEPRPGRLASQVLQRGSRLGQLNATGSIVMQGAARKAQPVLLDGELLQFVFVTVPVKAGLPLTIGACFGISHS